MGRTRLAGGGGGRLASLSMAGSQRHFGSMEDKNFRVEMTGTVTQSGEVRVIVV